MVARSGRSLLITRERLPIRIARRLGLTDTVDVLADLFIMRAIFRHTRSDNRPELAAVALKAWIDGVGASTTFIDAENLREKGCVESFSGRLHDELLTGKMFNARPKPWS